MANRKAKQGSGSQSIVRHPLFPTVAAFWFAALFGLGSLAVRTSLLETLVIASRIDLIVPQTAPPLGITARILIALAMAALGSIMGFILALRLARPRPEKQERTRTAQGFGARQSAASPVDAQYEQDRTERAAEPERRRALIASSEGQESIFDDGPSFLTGMSPHILDVTEFDFDPIDRQPAEPEQAEQPQELAPALELDQFATVAPSPTPAPTPGFEIFDVPQAAIQPDPSPPVQAAPLAQPVEAQAEPVQAIQRAFAAPAEQEARSAAAPEAMAFSAPVAAAQAPQEEAFVPEPESDAQGSPAFPAFVAPVTSPLQFSVGPAIAAAPAQPQASPAPGGQAPAEAVPAMAAETDDSDPLSAFRNKVAPIPVFDAEPDVCYDALTEDAAIHAEAAADPAPVADLEPDAVIEPAADTAGLAELLSVSPQLAVPMGAAAERLMNANLSDLSPVELIERLALSLQRRGQAVTLSRLPASQPVAAPAIAVQPEPVAAAVEAPVAAPAAAPVEAPAAAAAAEAPSRLTLPAAMRPIDFSQYEHEDDLPAYVPARSIARPSEAEAASAEPRPERSAQPAAHQQAPAMPRFGRPAEVEAPAAQTEDEVLEAGYSSLLDMSKPAGQRQQFVRVIDPEADTDAAEPVVIFPGQAMRAGTKFAPPSEGPVVAPLAPPPSLAETPGQPRRFDAPPAGQSAPARNPEETERALRSALSTLQRMSGAA